MADGLFVLVALCAVMAGASFLAGVLPLSFALSARQLRLITALGTGVLVGTSLVVIIPEGMETLYSAGGAGGHSHAERADVAVARRAAIPAAVPGMWDYGMRRRDTLPIAAEAAAAPPKTEDADSVTGPDNGLPVNEKDVEPHAPTQGGKTSPDGTPGAPTTPPHEAEKAHRHAGPNPHTWAGLALIAGFVLMYLIDTLPRHASTRSQPRRFSISLNSLNFNRPSSPPTGNVEAATPDSFSGAAHHHAYSSRPSSTTVGLVIHAAADGIALGASTTTTGRLSFIIFIALMIHKAPAAFGLTTVLLKQGLPKRTARAHLIVFSLAAPVGALLTWSAAHLLGYSSSTMGESTNTEFATGILLLFSGGTFLYVAVHTMQEEGYDDDDEGFQGNGYAGGPLNDMYDQPPPSKRRGQTLLDTMVTVGGMLLPLLTQWGHTH